MNERTFIKPAFFKLSGQLNYRIKKTLILFLIHFRLKYKKQLSTAQCILFQQFTPLLNFKL